jgi:hypothetical protein
MCKLACRFFIVKKYKVKVYLKLGNTVFNKEYNLYLFVNLQVNANLKILSYLSIVCIYHLGLAYQLVM